MRCEITAAKAWVRGKKKKRRRLSLSTAQKLKIATPIATDPTDGWDHAGGSAATDPNRIAPFPPNPAGPPAAPSSSPAARGPSGFLPSSIVSGGPRRGPHSRRVPLPSAAARPRPGPAVAPGTAPARRPPAPAQRRRGGIAPGAAELRCSLRFPLS